jgi:hypothetical protein
MSMSSYLRSEDGFAGAGDDFYAALLAAHEGLGDEQSAALHARLVLLLSNHIGDLTVIRAALAAARESVLTRQETV